MSKVSLAYGKFAFFPECGPDGEGIAFPSLDDASAYFKADPLTAGFYFKSSQVLSIEPYDVSSIRPKGSLEIIWRPADCLDGECECDDYLQHRQHNDQVDYVKFLWIDFAFNTETKSSIEIRKNY